MKPTVLLLAGLAPSEHLSMNRYTQELFAALGDARDNSRVITLEQPVQRRYLSRVFDHPQARRLDSAWSRYVAYPRSLRGREAAVFHILDHGYAQLMWCLDPDRTIVTCHDLIPLLAGEGVIPIRVPATVVRTFRWRIAQMHNARAVITDAHVTKTMIERYTSVRSERIVVVPLGVNSRFRPVTDAHSTTRATASVTGSARVVLQVATAGRYKNTRVLLEAFARMRRRLPDVVLVRIGVPFYPDEADLAATLGIVNSIRYLGIVDDSTLAAWYCAADVLVFPSLWEGFGWPPLEAMACGTPVVASNIPALAEVVGDAGILVPADDPSAVARATEDVLTDAALADSLRQKGLERASHYTWARTAAQTAAVYDQVLHSRGQSGVRGDGVASRW